MNNVSAAQRDFDVTCACVPAVFPLRWKLVPDGKCKEQKTAYKSDMAEGFPLCCGGTSSEECF